MITGEQLRDARSRAGLTQEQLANQVGTTLRSIGNWERGSGVPKGREAAIRDLLGDLLMGPSSNPLAEASDVALLAELGRRLARTEQIGATDGRAAAEEATEPGEEGPGAGGGEGRPGAAMTKADVDLAARDRGKKLADREPEYDDPA
mgnify:CR=1 FL=1